MTARVSWSDAPADTCSGVIRDYSPTGLRLQIGRTLPVASPVVISVNGHDFRGAVRYCTAIGKNFVLGVEFDPQPDGR